MPSIPLFVSANEFGLKRVLFDPERNARVLFSDDTRHGMQSADPARSDEPLAYFVRNGPLGDVFATWQAPEHGAQLAVIGLGVGSVATYVEPGQHVTFYEIDPGVVQIATDQQYFTFLSRCRGTYEIVLGEGRDMLAQAQNHHYSLIFIDAFTSDIIPPHLVSAEALRLYLDKLIPEGIVVFQITNVHVALEPVLAAMAAQLGLTCLARADMNISEEDRLKGKLASHYVVMTANPESVARLLECSEWTKA
jgi:hypothetical protein